MPLWSQWAVIDPYQTGSAIGVLFPQFNGWHGSGQLGGFTQQKWNGFEGRPQNYHMFGDLYIPKANSSLGGIVYTEIFGQTQSRVAAFNFTYRIHIGDLYLLPTIGYQRHQFVYKSNSSFPVDGISSQGISETHTGNQLNGGLGFIYDKWYGTIHYNGYSNINPKWIYVGAKYDFNGLAGVALGGEIMQRFRFSYSYDITTSRLGNQTLGSHELAMRIWLFKDKVKRQFLSNLPLM